MKKKALMLLPPVPIHGSTLLSALPLLLGCAKAMLLPAPTAVWPASGVLRKKALLLMLLP